MPPLAGSVAIVTGASRNAGRAIALALGTAGATVYVTGRSVRGTATTDHPVATIDETAELVAAAGGTAIAVPVDHTVDQEVAALFTRVAQEQGRLDVLVNNAWGGYEQPAEGFGSFTPFWDLPLGQWDRMVAAGLRSHLVASRLAMPLMLPQQRGLIINTTTGIAPLGAHHEHLFYDTVKVAINRISSGMATQCRPHGIAVIGLSLGDARLFMRTWDVDPAAPPAEVGYDTFSPMYVGRVVAALAGDADVLRWAGTQPFVDVPTIARAYGVLDVDGRQP